jgi:hypothetical protein
MSQCEPAMQTRNTGEYLERSKGKHDFVMRAYWGCDGAGYEQGKAGKRGVAGRL